MVASHPSTSQSNQHRRASQDARAAVLGGSLAVLVALYVVAWGQDAWWSCVLPIALLYLVPITLAALYYGGRDSLIVAGAAVLTLVPLIWRGFQLGQGLFSAIRVWPAGRDPVGWAAAFWDGGRAAALWLKSASDANLESATLRVRQLATLNDIGQAVLSSLDLDMTLSLIMDRVQEALDVESGSLMLIENRKLVFHTSFGPVGDRLKPYRLELGQGIVGWVALTGESILVEDAREDPRHLAEFDRSLAYQTRSILCVPLKGAENRVLGVIEAINPRNQEVFSKQDRELLESIATFAATAIQNARLYQQTLRYVTDLYALYEVGKEISSTLEIDEIIEQDRRRNDQSHRRCPEPDRADRPSHQARHVPGAGGLWRCTPGEPSLDVVVDDMSRRALAARAF